MDVSRIQDYDRDPISSFPLSKYYAYYAMIYLSIVCALLIILCIFLYLKNIKNASSTADSLEVLRDMLDEEKARSASLSAEIERARLRGEESARLSEILSPLKERIDIFNRNFTDARIKDSATHQQLHDQLERLMNLNSTIGKEARALSEALRGNSKVQGDWGEAVLERLLENAGLRKGVNYETQVTRNATGEVLRNEEGNLLRPDVVIIMPEDRRLIIDSKVSLTDYVNMRECETASRKEEYRKRHLASVRRHIDELYDKNYQKAVRGSADQVIMFIPVEGAFLEAANEDLWNYAYSHNVVIASPAHLAGLLHLVNQLWRKERENKSAEEIARQAGLLYDRFVLFAEDFLKVDIALNNARKAYDECSRRLSRGHLSLTARAEKLKGLGARTQKNIPETLLRENEIEELPE